MILPIAAYGHPILRKKAINIEADYLNLQELIANMFETMYFSKGVGLAAPQINLSIRIFVIDASPYSSEYPEAEGFKKVFINPIMIEEEGRLWLFNEGCLSVPEIREDISRKPNIKLAYYDENFNYFEENFSGLPARVIQHEYDHLEGIVFVDKLSPLKKMLLKRRLTDIMRGHVNIPYKILIQSKSKK